MEIKWKEHGKNSSKLPLCPSQKLCTLYATSILLSQNHMWQKTRPKNRALKQGIPCLIRFGGQEEFVCEEVFTKGLYCTQYL